jgi:hypothetical protein
MPKSGPAAIAVAAAVFIAGDAGAQTVIDMKGTWTGTAEAIVDGPAQHHPAPGAAGTKPAGKFRLSEQPFTVVIDGQDGRRFWGTTASATKTERLIGSLSVDGKTIVMVDDDGMLDGTVVNADRIEVCYRHVNTSSAVVACAPVTRKK